MALKKTISTPEGRTATYWRIAQLNASFSGGAGRIVLHGYVDQSYREESLGNVIIALAAPIPPNEVSAFYDGHVANMDALIAALSQDQPNVEAALAHAQQAHLYLAAYDWIKSRDEGPFADFQDATNHFEDLSDDADTPT